jgi:hypothetical protein
VPWACVALFAAILTGSLVLPAGAPAGTYSPDEYVVLVDGAAAAAVAEDHGLEASGSTEGPIPTMTVELTAAEAAALDADPRVSGLSRNVTFEANGDRIPPVVPRVDADQPPVSAGTSTTVPQGAIAILDTGVDTHPDYNLAGGVDCVFGSEVYTDGNGHGTGVAGVMASQADGSGIVGTAPGAAIYSVKVLDAKLNGNVSTLACGLNWVATHASALDIRVVNLSLGTYGTDTGNCGRTSGDVLHQAVCAVVEAGVVVVTAAGNKSRDFAGQVPAAYDEVLTVTNLVDFDGRPGGLATARPCSTAQFDDTPSTESNYAVSAADAAHTVSAPGECPFTTKKGNRYGYITSGTSMSSAAAAGVVLDCLQPGQPCAGQTPAQVISTIVGSAQAAGAAHGFPGDPSSQVGNRHYGYLVTTLFTGSGGPTTPPTTTPPTTTPPTTTPPTTTPPTTTPPTTTPPETTPPTTPPTTTPPTTTPPVADHTSPTAVITAPANGSVLSGVVVLRAEATDDVGVVAVRFYAGTILLGSATQVADGGWELVYDTRTARNATYSVVARAYDAAGNLGNSPALRLTSRN